MLLRQHYHHHHGLIRPIRSLASGGAPRLRRAPMSSAAAAAAEGGGDAGPQGAAPGWERNLLTETSDVLQLAASAKRVAVLGIKTEAQAGQPAFFVAEYLANAGVDVIPVPVFYPDVTTILGRPVVRRLQDIPESERPVDIVNVFRRPQDIPQHVDDILALRPRAVWLQSGIRNPEVERQLAQAGIAVVADRCLMVEHRRARL